MDNLQSRNNRLITRWLITGIVLVLLMVVIGGITRLTQSGLSMVHWKPLHFLPPLNEIQWQEEFSAYQTSPEFIHYNKHFDLSDFKKIYFWEYLHRLIGRILGLVFFIPFLYFYITKKIQSKRLLRQLLLIFAWGGLQGFLGWYMVKSGLVDNPHVSHYRLAIHLITAFTMVAYIYWVVLELKYPTKEKAFKSNLPVFLFFTALAQIIYGAFTAGLKAGFIYPTYPLMGNEFLPDEAKQTFISKGIVSLMENPSLVQFIHRWLGFLLVLLVIWMVLKFKKVAIAFNQKSALNFVLILIVIQFSLGILTLLLHVPIIIAVLHQLVAALFLLSVVRLWYFSKNTL